MVDASEVAQLRRAPQALDPPAVAAAAQRGPVVERVAPQLPGRAERVGRRAGDEAALEQLGVGDVVGAARLRRRAGCRRSAARRASPRSCAARSTRARSAPDRRRRPAPAKRSQSSIQKACAARKAASSAALDACVGLGQQARPARERRARGVRRARAVGRAERQHLPPRLPGGGEPVDERVGRRYRAARREAT